MIKGWYVEYGEKTDWRGGVKNKFYLDPNGNVRIFYSTAEARNFVHMKKTFQFGRGGIGCEVYWNIYKDGKLLEHVEADKD